MRRWKKLSENKVAVVCTVYNEGDSLEGLLDSLVNQTRKPDEAVFVDGGSDDRTQEVIQQYSEEHDWITLIVEDGCNIAEGRNIGIESADAEIIATTDGGCILDKKWLEKLLENFPEADVSAGMFLPQEEGSRFKEILGILETPNPDDLPAEWNPSARSQAFKREAWKAVGGFPEDLYTGEDAKFNRVLRDQDFEYRLAKDAVVYWEMRDSLKEVFDQYRLYGRGDAENSQLKGLLKGNYNSVKTAMTLGLAATSLTSFLGLITPLYSIPGILAFLSLGFYRSWRLGKRILNPLDLAYFLVVNLSMRYGFFIGFLEAKL